MQQLADTRKTMFDAAAGGDHAAAMQHLETLPALMDRVRASMSGQVQARASYTQQYRNIEATLRRVLDEDPGAGNRTLAAHDSLVQQAYDMEMAANAGDYVSAERQLLDIAPLIDKFRQVQKAERAEMAANDAARKRLDAKLGPIHAELERVAADVPLDAVSAKHRQEALTLDAQLHFAAMQNDYVAAEELAGRMQAELAAYREAKARAEKDPKLNYEKLRPTLESALKGALKPPRVDPFMLGLQQQIQALLGEIDRAVASRKFATAYPKLQQLRDLLKTFAEEEPKTPQPCEWLVGVTLSLMADADVKYNQAANKLDELADAYDAALKAHEGALSRMNDRRRLEQAILEMVFMVALPGAFGGANAAALKVWMGKKAADSMAGGALIDGAKDVIKFASKMALNVGGKAADAKPAGALQGNGVTLTRSMSRLLRAEKIKISSVLRSLGDLLASQAGECAKGKPIRVEGDPRKALQDDPFFKIIEGLGVPDQKGFATEIWREWIKTYAYQMQERKILLTGLESVYGEKVYRVEKSFDEELIPEIEKQVSGGFNVRRELEAAGARLRGQLDDKGAVKGGDLA